MIKICDRSYAMVSNIEKLGLKNSLLGSCLHRIFVTNALKKFDYKVMQACRNRYTNTIEKLSMACVHFFYTITANSWISRVSMSRAAEVKLLAFRKTRWLDQSSPFHGFKIQPNECVELISNPTSGSRDTYKAL